MSNLEKLSSTPEVYPVERVKNPALKYILVVSALMLLFLGFQLWAYHQAHLSVEPLLQRYQGQFIYFISLMILMLYLSSKINDRLPESFETHSGGITQVDRYGHKLMIAWDEIEKITRGVGIRKLGIECPAVKKRMFIPVHMAGYEALSARIWGEFGKRHEAANSNRQVFAITPSGKRTYWILGSVFTLISLVELVGGITAQTSLVHMHNPLFFQILFFIGSIGFGLFSYYLFRQAIRVSGKKLELNEQGIAQLDQIGNRVFIGWDEIDSLKSNPLDPAYINLRDPTGQKIIPIFSGYENHRDIEERVCTEFVARMKTPPFPAIFCKTMVKRQLIAVAVFFLLLCLLGYAIFSSPDTTIPGNQMAGYFILTVLFVGFGFMLSFVLRRVDRVTLDAPGVTLHRLAGDQFISWGNLAKVEKKTRQDATIDTPLFNLRLTDKNGKTYKIMGDLDYLLRLYAILKRKC